MNTEMNVITEQKVADRIICLRDENVLLDRDVAELYGTQTREINKAVRNNPDKFPAGYCFMLQPTEKQYLVENFHRMESLKNSTVEPRAFSEKGLYMLATILHSKQAVATTLAIIESFSRLRELSRSVARLQQEPDRNKQKGLMERTGELLSDILVGDGTTSDSETTQELNLLAVKFKHTVMRKKNNE